MTADDAVLIADRTGDIRKGTKNAGVQRQYTGTAGRIENAQVSAQLSYGSGKGCTLIDGDLHLGRGWAGTTDEHERRCAEQGISPGPWPECTACLQDSPHTAGNPGRPAALPVAPPRSTTGARRPGARGAAPPGPASAREPLRPPLVHCLQRHLEHRRNVLAIPPRHQRDNRPHAKRSCADGRAFPTSSLTQGSTTQNICRFGAIGMRQGPCGMFYRAASQIIQNE
ncbi:transposase [Streptomyces sp. R08]|uniref:Transposase n=1 Tax=Streptomyces sp. R08 TaxID=3238624 RepID=A0AB39MPB5_9ACTN